MSDIDRKPGWDKKAVNRIAHEKYGGLTQMFAAHGWETNGRVISQIAPTHVVKTYGSIAAFEDIHADEENANSFLLPYTELEKNPVNVWLTSFYGFDPEEWGGLGFSNDEMRQKFIDSTEAGVLVVIYNSNKYSPQWKKVIGILQCSHKTGHIRNFMSPSSWKEKQKSSYADKWTYAVKVTRAWRVSVESMIDIRDFAPQATATNAWQYIGSRGMRLAEDEALNIYKLDVQETDVYGEDSLIGSCITNAEEALKTSKAGPVSKKGFFVRESEGPKYLYILQLIGNADKFLGYKVKGKLIIKAGFSKSPDSRCRDFNRALPKSAYHWEVLYSGLLSNIDAYPSSDHAKAGEKVMHRLLCEKSKGESLGGEFFLTKAKQVEKAWLKGNLAAGKFEK